MPYYDKMAYGNSNFIESLCFKLASFAAFITDDTLDAFAENMYGINEYFQPKDGNERRLSRPLIALMDFNETGKFSKYYSYQVEHPVSSAFQEVMEIYRASCAQ